jgi:hypothetical protein
MRFVLAVILFVASVYGEPVRLLVLSSENSVPVPCRIHLKDAANKPIEAPGLPFWRDHFVCTGAVSLNLSPGRYNYEIERGPEYSPIENHFTVEANKTLALTNYMRQIVDLSKEGWWSGELHVHRPLADIELLMRAEDLHVAPVITWWNQSNFWRDRSPTNLIVQFDTNRFYNVMGGEEERAGGALLYLNLERPIDIASAKYEFPSPMTFLAKAREHSNVWVDIEKPFWYDAPIWMASGMVDSIGIANNHMYRSGVYPDEAWGRPRDVHRLAGAHGNGFWTQEIYYHMLNTGIRLPPSAGSASGVLPNPVGYNRAYVHVDGTLTYQKWFDGLRAGRVFVSNGPLLRVRANGELPGHVFKFQKGETLKIKVDALLDANDGLGPLQVIQNGKIVKSICGCDWNNSSGALGEISFDESGWLLVVAMTEVPETFRFASTGPFYVERADAPTRISKSSAQFFLDWIRERMARVKLDDPREREEVFRFHREAEHFWQDKVDHANAD